MVFTFQFEVCTKFSSAQIKVILVVGVGNSWLFVSSLRINTCMGTLFIQKIAESNVKAITLDFDATFAFYNRERKWVSGRWNQTKIKIWEAFPKSLSILEHKCTQLERGIRGNGANTPSTSNQPSSFMQLKRNPALNQELALFILPCSILLIWDCDLMKSWEANCPSNPEFLKKINLIISTAKVSFS